MNLIIHICIILVAGGDINVITIQTTDGNSPVHNQLVWHGKDDRGLVVQDGKFIAKLMVTDTIGRTINSTIASIEIRSQVPLIADETLSLD